MKIFSISLISALLIISCDTETTSPEVSIPTISLTTLEGSIDVGQKFDVIIHMIDFDKPIFGVSMKVGFDPNLLTSDSISFSYGDYFGAEVITFSQVEYDAVYLTISLIQWQTETTGTGILGQLSLSGKSTGNCEISITTDDVEFFNSTGEAVIFDDLHIQLVTMVIE